VPRAVKSEYEHEYIEDGQQRPTRAVPLAHSGPIVQLNIAGNAQQGRWGTGREIEMPSIAMPDYLIRLSGLGAAALFLLGNSVAHAAGDCLTKPNPGATEGAHWYYQTNQTTHQKCWYLSRPGADRGSADTTEAQVAPSSPPAPPSAMQQLVNVLTGNRENNEPKPPESNATAVNLSRVRGAGVTTATERPRHATRRVSRASGHPTNLDQRQRDALFREFLNWEAQKKDRVNE
jgi:hypothetical protein